MIKYTKSRVKPLTTSNFLNTTINIKKIKLLKHTILDTPGFNSSKNLLLNLENYRDILKLFAKKIIRPVNFQIDKLQSFILDSFMTVHTESNKGSITFYTSLDIKIDRCKTENLSKNLNTYSYKYVFNKLNRQDYNFELDQNKQYYIFINGFGKISIRNANKIVINTFDSVSINILSYE
jgi:hypothetical protein